MSPVEWTVPVTVTLPTMATPVLETVSVVLPSDITIDAGFRTIDVTARHAVRVESLPSIHGDPFDRLLIAQSMDEPLWFLTADTILANYSDLVILN